MEVVTVQGSSFQKICTNTIIDCKIKGITWVWQYIESHAGLIYGEIEHCGFLVREDYTMWLASEEVDDDPDPDDTELEKRVRRLKRNLTKL